MNWTCRMSSCAVERHPAWTLIQASCVAQWAAIHWAVFYEDDKNGNVVISVHIIDFITDIELQVVLVIFLKCPFSDCRMPQVNPVSMHTSHIFPLFTFMNIEFCGKSIILALFVVFTSFLNCQSWGYWRLCSALLERKWLLTYKLVIPNVDISTTML